MVCGNNLKILISPSTLKGVKKRVAPYQMTSKENGEITKVSPDEAKPDVPPRVLHKTTSIYLRTLPPSITKAEVVAMCKKFDGFLRAAIADPAPSQRWFRRGWITFDRDAKIKEICFSLNSIRLRDCDIGPAVNRDLARRIRPITGITIDRKIVRNDIKVGMTSCRVLFINSSFSYSWLSKSLPIWTGAGACGQKVQQWKGTPSD